MRHDPIVCVEEAVQTCELILQFVEGMDENNYCIDSKTKAAVQREFEIIGEALSRIKKIVPEYLKDIDDWQEIIEFRNVIAHGYDVI